MRLLLDTHTFLWFNAGSDRLSEYARHLIEASSNERLLSIASLWEMSIKSSIGKLELTSSFSDLVENQVKGNAIDLLMIDAEHLDIQKSLPCQHRDPFDRLMIAQSMAEQAPILGRDIISDSYEIERLWEG